MQKKICLVCGSEFQVWPYEIKRAKYCGKQCFFRSKLGKRSSPGTEFKVGNSFWEGKKRPEIKEWLSPFKKGHTPWNEGLRGYMSEEKHWNWKGGVTPIRRKMRETYENRVWRKAVLERDNYTCQICGNKDNLQVDHIKRWKENIKLRYVTGNGRVLCFDCHKKTDTYGNRKY